MIPHVYIYWEFEAVVSKVEANFSVCAVEFFFSFGLLHGTLRCELIL